MVTSYNGKHYFVEEIDGITVHWVPNYYSNTLGIASRVFSFFTFSIKSYLVARRVTDADVCFATSTPLTIGLPALMLKWFRKLPYVFEVRDLWPEFPIQMGALQSKPLQFLARAFEKMIYDNACSVVALSPGMRDGVLRCCPGKEVVTVPNCADLDIFRPHPADNTVCERYGLGGTFNVVHFGAMGLANGLDYIMETARVCRDSGHDDMRFVFAGTGRVEPDLKAAARKHGLTNVVFLGFLPKHEVARIVNVCDVSITSFLDLPVLHMNSPNKLFDSLAAGKVCFVNSSGWTRDLVEKNECGFYVSPHDPADFLEKLLRIRNEPELKARMEKNARALAEREFDRKKLAVVLLQFIKDSVIVNPAKKPVCSDHEPV